MAVESIQVQRRKALLAGLASGTLNIGARQPVAGTPVWVTPEITQEGFATGRLLAELPPNAVSNRSWLTLEGLERLRAMLDSGCYEVRYPEHGALPAIVALIDAGREAEAVQVLQAIEPWLERLQFYPQPRDRPAQPSAMVQLMSVQDVATHLEAKAARPPPPAAEAWRRAVEVLRPLYHELVSLFLETVPQPDMLLDAAGAPAGTPYPAAAGAWPCQAWPAGWQERGAELAERCVRQGTSRLNKRKLARGSMARLLAILRRVAANGPLTLGGRDVGMVCTILVDFVRKYGGPPGSDAFKAVSPKYLSAERFGYSAAFAPALLARLRALPELAQGGGYVSAAALGYEVLGEEGGGEGFDPLLAPISAEEAASVGLPAHVRAGDGVPACLARHVRKCFCAPLERLIELKVVTSLEMLAVFSPQLAADAAPIADACARRLHAQVYCAFRRGRRTLLLRDLQSQVRLEELPWVRAMESFRRAGGALAAREALLLLARTALASFPGEGVPNKLQQDLRALMAQARTSKEHPLLEGLAADIFEGRFAPKFKRGALSAARFVRAEAGLYERFWKLGAVYDEILGAGENVNLDALIARTCVGTRVGGRGESWIAENHRVIQWQRVVCANNMVTLLEGFGLRAALSDGEVRGMAVGALRNAKRMSAQGASSGDWKGRLRCGAQTNTALLQGTLLLALLPSAEQAAVLGEAMEWAPAQREFANVLRKLMGHVEG